MISDTNLLISQVRDELGDGQDDRLVVALEGAGPLLQQPVQQQLPELRKLRASPDDTPFREEGAEKVNPWQRLSDRGCLTEARLLSMLDRKRGTKSDVYKNDSKHSTG